MNCKVAREEETFSSRERIYYQIPFTTAGALLTLHPTPRPLYSTVNFAVEYRPFDQISQLGTYLPWRSDQRRTSCANVVWSTICEIASSTFRHVSEKGVSVFRAVRVRGAWEPST